MTARFSGSNMSQMAQLGLQRRGLLGAPAGCRAVWRSPSRRARHRSKRRDATASLERGQSPRPGSECAWPSWSGHRRKRPSPSHAFLDKVANRRAGSRAVERRGSPVWGRRSRAGEVDAHARRQQIRSARPIRPCRVVGGPVSSASVLGRLLLLREPAVNVVHNGPYASVDGGPTGAGQSMLQSNTAWWAEGWHVDTWRGLGSDGCG